MAKSTPIPMVDLEVLNSDVFIASHTWDGNQEILGIFTNEKAAKKCAAASKRKDGFKGKEAKLHAYTIGTWSVDDKFDG